MKRVRFVKALTEKAPADRADPQAERSQGRQDGTWLLSGAPNPQGISGQGCDRIRLLQRIGLLTRRGLSCEGRANRSGITGMKARLLAHIIGVRRKTGFLMFWGKAPASEKENMCRGRKPCARAGKHVPEQETPASGQENHGPAQKSYVLGQESSASDEKK